ncbi:MAG: zinc-binding dehydrogenase [Pseudomonadota bacterium]
MPYAMMIPHTGGPEVLERQTKAVSEPGTADVLVRNHATAVNFIDTIIRRGEMPDGMMPELPHIPGVEGAGVVEAVGAEVTTLKPGDRVAWMGPIGASGYGSHAVIGQSYVTGLADDVDFEMAAALPVNAMTAWHMVVNLGRIEAGSTVLVHAAAGGVGTMILQIARYLGVETMASVSTDKRAYALEQGADHAIDYRREDVAAHVLELTDGRGVDLTLNPISGETLKADLEVLSPFGTAVVFGFLAGPPAGTFAEDLAKHFQKSIAIRISDIYTYFGNRPEAFQNDLAKVFGLLKEGALRPRIDVLPLDQAAEAHRRLEAGEVMGKLVLSID